MGITDSFLNKVEKKTNVSKESILNLASRLKGGNLNIYIDENEDIILTGPAENVFEGKIDL